MVQPMTRRLAHAALALVLSTVPAVAQPTTSPAPPPAPSALPAIGANVAPNGAVGWPSPFEWLYDAPAMTDAAGKIVIHWFCAPKIQTCVDDLARITTLKENSTRVYVIAYINGSKRDAQKLDPIRESEGVGRGTVAFGKNVAKLFKQLAITGPVSIIADVESKVALVATGATPGDLDARDSKVATLAAGIKDFTTTFDGPKTVAVGQKFSLSLTIHLAPWLIFSKKPNATMEFRLTVPKDIKCDQTVLKGDQLKVANQTLTATATCTAPRGSYEARGQINFSYDTPGGAAGLGADGGTWKFEIR
jgi:hypothetical protein